MELFILLVLIICGCQASPLQREAADCNDPEVFQAVDLALNAHNRQQTHGNLFALSVILEAERTPGLGKNIFVKYQLQETSCAVVTDTPWQNCEFLAPSEGDTGICEAEVHIDDTVNYLNIEQKCNFSLAPGKVNKSFHACLGCWQTIDPKSVELLPIVRNTIMQFNNQSKENSLFDVREITKAKHQVVAGWNYKIEYSIKETNCSKEKFPNLTPVCQLNPEGGEGTCTVEAYVDIRNTLVRVEQKCKLMVDESKTCMGCPRSISTHSEELKEPLDAAVEKYNSESEDGFYYRVDSVKKATVQVVAGLMFRIEFEMKRTNCSKAEVNKLTNDCVTSEESIPLNCIGSVYVRSWEREVASKVVPKVKCERPHMMMFARRPPGNTPFRSVLMTLIPPFMERHHKDGSEAIREDIEKPQDSIAAVSPNEDSLVSPVDLPSQDSILPSVPLFETVPDLPEPKCPGTPWKPIIPPITAVDEPRDFDLGDLLPIPGDESTAGPTEMVPPMIEQLSDDFEITDVLS